MSIDLAAAARVLRKEIREATRDRNLVVNLVLVPLFLYPLVGFGAFQAIQIIQGISERRATLVGTLGDVPAAVFDSLSAPEKRAVAAAPAELAAALRRGDATAFRAWRLAAQESDELPPEALLVWPEGGEAIAGEAGTDGAAVAAADSAEVWFDRSRDRSTDAKAAIVDAFDSWRRARSLVDLAAVGLGESDLEPWPIEEENTASASEIGSYVLSLVLPMVLLLMLAMGTFYAGLDTVVGERERGTLETLLVSPLKRGEIILGKYLWVLLASVTTMVLNLASMAFFLGFVLKLIDSEEKIQVGIAPSAFVLILVTAILTAALVSAVLMVAAIPARSYREGQATLTPLYLLILVPGLVVASSAAPFTWRHALVPLLNSTALFEAALEGSAEATPVAVTWIVLAVATAIALRVAARIVAREDVYLENEMSLRELLRGRGGRNR